VADATRRRALYDLAILWLKEDRPRTEEGGEQRQSQARATNHATSWPGEQSARAKYLEAASGTHQVSVFAERSALIEPPRSLEYGYNLHSASSGVRVSRSCDRLVQSPCARIPSLERLGRPKIFNTDQGVQFTSKEFVSAVLEKNIRFSMDGRGRALDNVFVERLWRSVKYENVYLEDYQNVLEARTGLGSYFRFYNTQRPHQSLAYKTPYEVHYVLAK